MKPSLKIIKKLIAENEDLIRDAADSCRIKGLAVEDLDGNRLLKYGSITGDSAALAAYPIIAGEETIGFVKETEKVPYIASLISNLIRSGIEKINLAEKNTRLSEDLHESFRESVIAMAESVEIRDYRTGSHVKRVAEYSAAVGKELNLDKNLMERLKFSAILHDIGKIGIKDEILLKPGRLSNEEYNIMKEHPLFGAKLLENIKQLKHVIPGVKEHHERWDGKGYPYGLKGKEIDITARIISVGDSFDAMTAARTYRKAPEDYGYAFNEIRRRSGSQFCPECSEAFLKVFSSDTLRIRNLNKKDAKIAF